MKRQDANRKILEVLENSIETMPDLRFHQILQTLNIVRQKPKIHPDDNIQILDQYYEESDITLDNLKAVNREGVNDG